MEYRVWVCDGTCIGVLNQFCQLFEVYIHMYVFLRVRIGRKIKVASVIYALVCMHDLRVFVNISIYTRDGETWINI